MKENFTPGRWRAKGNCVRWKARDPFCTDNLFNGLICKCIAPDGVPEAKEEVTANVHLIAAAPKMYQRLKSVKTDLWALSVNPAISTQTKECIDIIIKNVEGDLKKARGEE